MIRIRRYVPYIGFLVSLAFLWFAIRDIDFKQLQEVFREADYGWTLGIAVCVLLFYWLKALRWRRILSHKVDASARTLAGPMMVGFAANNVLPMRLGELVRVYLAAKGLDVSKSLIVSSLLIERLLDLLTILCLLGFGLWWIGRDHIASFTVGIWLALFSVGLLLGLVVLTTHSDALEQWVERRFAPGGPFGKRVARAAKSFMDGLGILRTRWSLFIAMLNSVVQWSLLAFAITMSYWAVGIQAPLTASFICLAMVTLAIAVPAAPGFFGVVELAFVLALKPFGVSGELAIAAALYYHLTLYVLVTVIGVGWLHYYGYNWRKLRGQIAASSENRVTGESP